MKNQRCPIIRIKKNGTEVDKVSVPIGRTGMLSVNDVKDEADKLLTEFVDEGVDTKNFKMGNKFRTICMCKDYDVHKGSRRLYGI